MANVTKELVLNETFMSTEQTPRNVADILADELENIANAIEGGGSGGHIIQDASGTDLAQEAKLQFGGMLKATDDSENGVTKVSDLAEEVEWSVWNAMTEAQRTAYSAGKKLDIINVPSVSGSIPVELIKTLWTNPNPSASFAAQTITLASDDYDFLLCIHLQGSVTAKKGQAIHLSSTVATATTMGVRRRIIDYVSDTSLSVRDNYYANRSSNTDSYTVQNDGNVPLAVYGIKSSVNVDMSALVANVSTSASKCMLSDGETSVEDAIDDLTANNGANGVDITSYSSSSNKYIFPSDGYIVEAIGAQTSGKCIVLIYGANGASIANLCLNAAFNYQCSSVFVKKGMSCYVYSRDSNVSVEFRGLT